METEYLPDSAATPIHDALLPLYFIVFARVAGWMFGHRFTEWPVAREHDPQSQYKLDVNLLQATLCTPRSRLPAGFAGCTVPVFGAIAACGVDLNIAPIPTSVASGPQRSVSNRGC
jgi:hypothetical protein